MDSPNWLRAVRELADPLQQRIRQLESENIPRRIAQCDPTLWSQDAHAAVEIQQRLGWLESPTKSQSLLAELIAFAAECRAAGFTHTLLLGMGGSSLAPEVMALTFPKLSTLHALNFSILDSTNPVEVRAAARRAPIQRTLILVASKSGETAEISAFLEYFWSRAHHKMGEKTGQQFVAITDPGTSLEALARQRRFRRIFSGDPTVGGRYSALTVFGLLPAVLIGLDVNKLLCRAQEMAMRCKPDKPAVENPGLVLGALLGQAALLGRNKLTFIADPQIAAFGSWLEQLIAESSGKQGKGIIPIDLEPPLPADRYGRDRLFVYLRITGRRDTQVKRLLKHGQPVITLHFQDGYDLGAEFYRWKYATAVACSILGVNGFDQPDVQDSKDRTRHKISAFKQSGRLEDQQFSFEVAGVRIATNASLNYHYNAPTLRAIIDAFLEKAKSGDYVAINAYLPRKRGVHTVLQGLRHHIALKTGCATTLGYGPRFLHSTGQLHKGGSADGLFLQITRQPPYDLEIPQQGISFGTLQMAQAIGDFEALLGRNRRVMRIHLPTHGLKLLDY